MKSILVNSQNKSISLVEINKVYPDANKLIGCDTITVAQDIGADSVYVDDEGLLCHPQTFFRIKKTNKQANQDPRFFAGNGLICGFDDETGESRDVSLSLENIEVEFFDVRIFEDQIRFSRALREIAKWEEEMMARF